MRSCLNQSCFPTLTVREFVAVAARASVRSVELRVLDSAEPVWTMRAAVQAAEVRVEAVNALMDWALPDDPDPASQLERLLEVAQAVGAPLIVCVAPIRMGGMPPSERIMQCAAERLATLAQRTAPTGIRLAFEQVGRSSSRPGAQSGIQRLADALDIVEAAGYGAVLALDSYNLATAGEDYQRMRSLPLERIGIAHLVDQDRTSGARTLPGEGKLPLDDFVAALQETGYNGALSIETFPPAPWPDPVSFARQAIRRAREYIKRSAAWPSTDS